MGLSHNQVLLSSASDAKKYTNFSQQNNIFDAITRNGSKLQLQQLVEHIYISIESPSYSQLSCITNGHAWLQLKPERIKLGTVTLAEGCKRKVRSKGSTVTGPSDEQKGPYIREVKNLKHHLRRTSLKLDDILFWSTY